MSERERRAKKMDLRFKASSSERRLDYHYLDLVDVLRIWIGGADGHCCRHRAGRSGLGRRARSDYGGSASVERHVHRVASTAGGGRPFDFHFRDPRRRAAERPGNSADLAAGDRAVDVDLPCASELRYIRRRQVYLYCEGRRCHRHHRSQHQQQERNLSSLKLRTPSGLSLSRPCRRPSDLDRGC
jgi:hypothetical protein